MSGHGKRKFRLTAPKNWLRRKYAARPQSPEPLPVSISLETLLPSFSELRSSLESHPIPDWILVCGSAYTLQLCRMENGHDSGPPKVSVCVEIRENLEWSVYVWSKKLDNASHPLLCSQLIKLRSVDDVQSLLKVIEGCKICKGNGMMMTNLTLL